MEPALPVHVGLRCANPTYNDGTAEFDVTNGDEAGVVDAFGNGKFGKAFEVLNENFESRR